MSPLVPKGPHEHAGDPPEESDHRQARIWEEQDPDDEPSETADEFGDEWQEEMAYRTELRERHARAAEFDREYDRKLQQLAQSLRTLRSDEDPAEPQRAPARGARATREQYSPQDLDRDVYIEGVRLPRFLQASYVPPLDREGGYHLRAILAVAIAGVIAAPFVYYFTSGNPFAPSRDKLSQPALEYTVASTSASLPPLDPPEVHDLQPANNVAPYAPMAAPQPAASTPQPLPQQPAVTAAAPPVPQPQTQPRAATTAPRAVPLTRVMRWPDQAQDRPAPPPSNPASSVLALAPTTTPAPPEPAPAAPLTHIPLRDSDEIQLLLKQGQEFVTDGDVATARIVLRRAAEAGVAAAALALGRTYDPHVLAKMRARGVASDTAEARRWYEMAQRLGSDEATQQLERLARDE